MMKKRSGFAVMAKLIGLVKPLLGFMVLAVTMGVIGHLCASFITIFGAFSIAKLLNIDIPLTLGAMFISIGIFSVVRGVLRYAEQACNHYIAFKLLALIRDKVFAALRKLCPAKLDGKDKGNLISVITSDIELLEVFYAHTISPVIIAVIFSAVMTVFIASFNVWLAVITLAAYFTVGAVIPIMTSKLSRDDGIKFRTKSGELSSFVLDSLRGLFETLQFSQGEKRLGQINERTDSLSKDEYRLKLTEGSNRAVTNTVILVFDVLMLFAAATLYQLGAVGFIGVLIPTIALMSSFGPVVALANLGSTLQNTFAAGNRVLDILEETPAVEEVDKKDKADIAFDGARVDNVTFSYGGEKILDNVSLKIPRGSVVGISGRSGSGKSTLLKLIMRFWDVQSGEVKISDVNVANINTSNLRDMQSFVTQQTHLFHDSIKNNLLIAKADADDEEIQSACKKASVHDFIMSLPNGYDTNVGELGDTLSGGERQRLGLARAFLHNAPLMLLDEPTSNLDSLNEAVILKALKKERKSKTVVLVSHRKSTMRIVDSVYSVENGRMS